jgi:hypothetical protein
VLRKRQRELTIEGHRAPFCGAAAPWANESANEQRQRRKTGGSFNDVVEQD